jgi:gluconate 5-dehydrogenase
VVGGVWGPTAIRQLPRRLTCGSPVTYQPATATYTSCDPATAQALTTITSSVHSYTASDLYFLTAQSANNTLHMSSLLNRLFSLAGKTALITGASGGIGTALAVALAEVDATVGVHGRSPERVAGTCRLIEGAGGRAYGFTSDLVEIEASRQLIADAVEKMGRLDILVNCAGMNRRKPVLEVTPDDYDTIMSVNLRSSFFLCQAAHPHMQAQGGGKIININSLNAVFGLGTISVYGASKAGLAQITRVMAVEWAIDNIQVNGIAPGFIRTPLTEGPLWGAPHRAAWLRNRIPMRRPGEPEDLIGAVLLLAGPASAYMTGTMIVVDGGFLAGGSWETET